jgi:hypothetical protein
MGTALSFLIIINLCFPVLLPVSEFANSSNLAKLALNFELIQLLFGHIEFHHVFCLDLRYHQEHQDRFEV